MKEKNIISIIILLLILSLSSLIAQETPKSDSLKNVNLSGLSFRSIGPAVTGGRIIDIAVNPNDYSNYFVASGNGGLWKTLNNGITFTSVFDIQNSFLGRL